MKSFISALIHGDYNKIQNVIDKRILAPVKPQYRRVNVPNFMIMTNNTCNLKCVNCTITTAPWEKQVTPIDSITSFLKNIQSWQPDKYIQLSGGEVTILPSKYLETILEAIRQANRKPSIYTNGHNPALLHLFDHVILDDHGVNRKDIKNAVGNLDTKKKEGWKGHFDIRHSLFHYDLREAIKGNITEGCRCPNWNTKITLWGEAVYPCCVVPAISAFNGIHDQLQEKLIENGWTPHNENLPQTIENWRGTLPPEIYKLCQTGCWKGGNKIWSRI